MNDKSSIPACIIPQSPFLSDRPFKIKQEIFQSVYVTKKSFSFLYVHMGPEQCLHIRNEVQHVKIWEDG